VWQSAHAGGTPSTKIPVDKIILLGHEDQRLLRHVWFFSASTLNVLELARRKQFSGRWRGFFFLSSGWLACAGNCATKVGSTLASLRMRTSRTGSPSYLERGVVTLGAAAAAGSGFTAAEDGWGVRRNFLGFCGNTHPHQCQDDDCGLPEPPSIECLARMDPETHDHIPGYGIWLLLVR